MTRRNLSLAIARNHRQRSTRQVSQSTRQIAIGAVDECLVSESTILTETHLTQAELTDGIHRKMTIQSVQLHGVAYSFRHLASGRIQPHSVCHDRARQFDASRHQKSRPIDRVEPKNVLAD